MKRFLIKNFPLLLLLVFALIIVAMTRTAFADRITQSNDQNLQTTGDVSIGSGSSNAFGVAGGDVDIAQCYRSYNYLIVWQDTKPNLLCQAELDDAKGLHKAAARKRCAVRAVARLYESHEECLAENTVSVAPPQSPAPALAEIPTQLAEHEEVEEQHDNRLDAIEAALVRESQRRRAAQQAFQEAEKQRLIEQQAEQEYAQQALRELEQWK
jgi:hypothetical protein